MSRMWSSTLFERQCLQQSTLSLRRKRQAALINNRIPAERQQLNKRLPGLPSLVAAFRIADAPATRCRGGCGDSWQLIRLTLLTGELDQAALSKRRGSQKVLPSACSKPGVRGVNREFPRVRRSPSRSSCCHCWWCFLSLAPSLHPSVWQHPGKYFLPH